MTVNAESVEEALDIIIQTVGECLKIIKLPFCDVVINYSDGPLVRSIEVKMTNPHEFSKEWKNGDVRVEDIKQYLLSIQNMQKE